MTLAVIGGLTAAPYALASTGAAGGGSVATDPSASLSLPSPNLLPSTELMPADGGWDQFDDETIRLITQPNRTDREEAAALGAAQGALLAEIQGATISDEDREAAIEGAVMAAREEDGKERGQATPGQVSSLPAVRPTAR